MNQGEFIYGYDVEAPIIIDLLKRLKGSNRLFFALTSYDRGHLEYELGYTIGNKIVADTRAEDNFELLRRNIDLQWFEPATDQEWTLCIESNPLFFAGCVLDEGSTIKEALYTFDFIENYTLGDDDDCALFIGAKNPMKVKTFMYTLEDYKDLQPPGHGRRLWLYKDSVYHEAWR
jgi:hypothetical protein